MVAEFLADIRNAISELVILWIFITSMVGFCIMGIDKYKAIHEKWRIKEKTLFLVAIAGGAVGSTIGMYSFHHKTKHWYFKLGFPFLAIIWILVYYNILKIL